MTRLTTPLAPAPAPAAPTPLAPAPLAPAPAAPAPPAAPAASPALGHLYPSSCGSAQALSVLGMGPRLTAEPTMPSSARQAILGTAARLMIEAPVPRTLRQCDFCGFLSKASSRQTSVPKTRSGSLSAFGHPFSPSRRTSVPKTRLGW